MSEMRVELISPMGALYKQPIDNELDANFSGMQEFVNYLPGTSLRIWYTHQKTSCSAHWHDAMEIVVGTCSNYAVETEAQSYIVGKDDILFIPRGIVHTLKPEEDCNGFVYLLNLDYLSLIKSTTRLSPLFTHPILINRDDLELHGEVACYLKEMRDVYFSDNDLRELLIDAKMLILLEMLARKILPIMANQDQSFFDKTRKYKKKFDEIQLYVDQHHDENLTTESVAKVFGFSKYHFSRLFKEYTNYPFHDYLIHSRLRVATHLMTQPGLSITEIALQSGFSSLSTFSRLFKQRLNCTPIAYRMMYVKDEGLK